MSFTNLESVLDGLKSGYKIIKKQNSVSLSAILDYGDWLNIAFHFHSTEKQQGKSLLNWKEWLDRSVGIQDSYARKIRETSKLLGNFPRFRLLGLPFSEVYLRRKEIESMLVSDRRVAQYWQELKHNDH